MRKRTLSVMLALSLAVSCLDVVGCARNVKPDVAVASYSTDIVKAVTELQIGVTQLGEAKLIPAATVVTITDKVEIFSAKVKDLSAALKAYHAVTTPIEQQSKGALVQALIGQLSGPLADILGVAVPQGTVQRVMKLVGTATAAIAAVQAAFAKDLTPIPGT